MTKLLDPSSSGYGLYLYQSIPALNFKLDPNEKIHRVLVNQLLQFFSDSHDVISYRSRYLESITKRAKRLGLASNKDEMGRLHLASDLSLRVGEPPWGDAHVAWIKTSDDLRSHAPSWLEA